MPGARKETTPVAIENPIYVARVAPLGGYTVVFETIRMGGDAAPIFQSLPDDRCPCPHWGVVVSGRITMRYADHEETFVAGDTFYNPAGHIPDADPGTELITFSPTEELARVNTVIARNQAALAAAHASGATPEGA
jgi:hypothetical protein